MSKVVNCPHCDREVDVRGARLHIALCEKNPSFQKVSVRDLEKKEKIESIPDENCQHEFFLLGDTIEHKQVKAAGYVAYCRKCEELK
jgi:predicted metalloprotease